MDHTFPAFLERYNFQRRLEPDDVLHGAGQDPGVRSRYDPRPLHNYWQAMGEAQRPIVILIGIGIVIRNFKDGGMRASRRTLSFSTAIGGSILRES